MLVGTTIEILESALNLLYFKCGEEGHRSRGCPLKDIKCTKCGHPSHSAEHHDRVMEMLKRRAERDRNSDDKSSNAKASSAVYVL